MSFLFHIIVDFLFISLCDLCVCYLCFVLFFCSKQLLDGLLKVVCCTSCIVSCVLDRDDEAAHCNACASVFGSCEPQGSVGTLVHSKVPVVLGTSYDYI